MALTLREEKLVRGLRQLSEGCLSLHHHEGDCATSHDFKLAVARKEWEAELRSYVEELLESADCPSY